LFGNAPRYLVREMLSLYLPAQVKQLHFNLSPLII
jgi:hypothetical protein